jgi:leucyl aminopeptidase
MRVRVSTKDLTKQKVDAAFCFAYEGDKQPRGILDRALRRKLAARMKAESFRALPGDCLVWNADGGYGPERFLVVGLGKERETPGKAIRPGCARAAREAAKYSARSVALRLPEVSEKIVPIEARAAIEGVTLGAYHFDRYLTDPTRREVPLEVVELAADDAGRKIKKAVGLGEIGARAVCDARDLVNEGPSRKAPVQLARAASKVSRAAGLRCKILGQTELRKMGMESLLAVSRGSQVPPRVVHLTYRPGGRKSKERIILVGKGVTFDSGGLNLKPGDSMEHMKSDMAGAAAILAAMSALEQIGCRAEVHGLLGLVENMTGQAAYKPGDILATYAGKSVEVVNTDAEGRLVLCDLLAYAADRLKPTILVDLATLTGACVVALGELVSGLFTRHDELCDALAAAGRSAGERSWRMPLFDEYLEQLQKGPADLRNIGNRWGGAITAALFLGEFVPRDLPWLHMDIAGPAFTEKDLPEARTGATGAGVLTLLRWLETF